LLFAPRAISRRCTKGQQKETKNEASRREKEIGHVQFAFLESFGLEIQIHNRCHERALSTLDVNLSQFGV
jgi:hypothetical protein